MCVKADGTKDTALFLALGTMTLVELFTFQDVAVCEGDRLWQMTEFRKTDTPSKPKAPKDAPPPSREVLMSQLPTDFAAKLRNAVAEKKQAARATPFKVNRKKD